MKKVKKYENIEGMSQIGEVDDCEIYVNTNDPGNVPHFHYRNKDDWDKFHTCICIDKPEYFHHSGKEDVLNAKQRKNLQNFMMSKPKKVKYSDKFDTNWQVICFMWDMNNSNVMISEDTTQPDYLITHN